MRLLPGLLAVALSGCVSQGLYDALRHEQDSTQEELSQKNAALESAEKKASSLSAKNDELEKALADEKDSVKSLNARLARLNAEMALAGRDKNRLQSNIEQMTLAISELEARRVEAEARVQEFKNLLARFKGLIDAGKLKVRIIDGRMVVVLASDVLFASGSASLSKDGAAAVVEVAQVLSSIPKRTFQVEGHTDNVPIATAQYPGNWELAAARAITVLRSMINAGLPAARISAASLGDARAAASNDSAEGRALNRRIEIIIVPDLSGLPGFGELQKAGG